MCVSVSHDARSLSMCAKFKRSQDSHMTYDPLAIDGKATVERFLFSASVRQFLTHFSKLVTPSLADQEGLWTWMTYLHGRVSPDPLMAAVSVCVYVCQSQLHTINHIC